MYAPRFGLKQEPFSIAPDPRFLYMSERHREALAHLLYGVQGGGGFVLLTGAVGAGKTTVCRGFLEQLPEGCDVAYIFNPKLSVRELLKTVCDEFGIADTPPVGTVKDFVDPLNRFLLAGHAAGRSRVLVIDEAQNLSPDVLEQLRLLTNLETDTRKLLQIILIGQPELRERLAEPGMEQLAQRVIARYHLAPLTAEETPHYVRHRLAVAGLSSAVPFDARALRRIHHHSRGVPRRINLLCDRALLGAYAEGRSQVDAATVDRAAAEVFDDAAAGGSRVPAWRRPAGVAAALAAVVLLAAGGWWAGRQSGRTAADGPVAPTASASPDAAPAAVPGAGGDTLAATALAPAEPASASAVPLPRLDAAALAARAPALWPDEASAWRALAARWVGDGGAAPLAGGDDPCQALARQDLACWQGSATLALVRQLDRPGWLTLQAAGGEPARVLLLGLGIDSARLQGPEATFEVPLPALATLWRGDFATLWRTPPGYETGAVRPGSPLAGWLLAQLGAYQAGALPLDVPLRDRIEAFQRAQGLQPDGLAGPLTLMQLNRAVAVAEPRLVAER